MPTLSAICKIFSFFQIICHTSFFLSPNDSMWQRCFQTNGFCLQSSSSSFGLSPVTTANKGFTSMVQHSSSKTKIWWVHPGTLAFHPNKPAQQNSWLTKASKRYRGRWQQQKGGNWWDLALISWNDVDSTGLWYWTSLCTGSKQFFIAGVLPVLFTSHVMLRTREIQ